MVLKQPTPRRPCLCRREPRKQPTFLDFYTHFSALAHLKLLEAMEIIDEYRVAHKKAGIRNGAKILYIDTDSVIFRYKKSEWPEMRKRLKVENQLGHLKEEKKNHTILEYVCGGPKQYYLKVCFCL